MMKILALIFAIMIIIKIFFIFVFKKEMKMFSNYLIKNKTLYYTWQSLIVLGSIILFYFIFENVELYTVAAIMFACFTIFGLLISPYPKTVKRFMDDYFDQPFNLGIIFFAFSNIGHLGNPHHKRPLHLIHNSPNTIYERIT